MCFLSVAFIFTKKKLLMGKIVRLNEHVLRLIETLTNSNQLYIIENDIKSLFRAIVVR